MAKRIIKITEAQYEKVRPNRPRKVLVSETQYALIENMEREYPNDEKSEGVKPETAEQV